MDYKRVIALHFTNGLSGREIAKTRGRWKNRRKRISETLPGMYGTVVSPSGRSHQRVYRGRSVQKSRESGQFRAIQGLR